MLYAKERTPRPSHESTVRECSGLASSVLTRELTSRGEVECGPWAKLSRFLLCIGSVTALHVVSLFAGFEVRRSGQAVVHISRHGESILIVSSLKSDAARSRAWLEFILRNMTQLMRRLVRELFRHSRIGPATSPT